MEESEKKRSRRGCSGSVHFHRKIAKQAPAPDWESPLPRVAAQPPKEWLFPFRSTHPDRVTLLSPPRSQGLRPQPVLPGRDQAQPTSRRRSRAYPPPPSQPETKPPRRGALRSAPGSRTYLNDPTGSRHLAAHGDSGPRPGSGKEAAGPEEAGLADGPPLRGRGSTPSRGGPMPPSGSTG